MMRSIVVGFRPLLPADENVSEASWGPEQKALAIRSSREWMVTIVCYYSQRGAAVRPNTDVHKVFCPIAFDAARLCQTIW
jgi:hypothetical protein